MSKKTKPVYEDMSREELIAENKKLQEALDNFYEMLRSILKTLGVK